MYVRMYVVVIRNPFEKSTHKLLYRHLTLHNSPFIIIASTHIIQTHLT
jgi:hypothetical protein